MKTNTIGKCKEANKSSYRQSLTNFYINTSVTETMFCEALSTVLNGFLMILDFLFFLGGTFLLLFLVCTHPSVINIQTCNLHICRATYFTSLR